MTRMLHIAAAQVHSGGSVEQTIGRIERQARSAAAVNVDLLLFAEGVLHGYDYDMTFDSVRAAAEPIDGPNCDKISATARKYGMTILAGFFESEQDRVYNSMLVAWPDGRRQAARKHALAGAEITSRLSRGERERLVIEVNGVRCAVIVCADCGIKGLYENLKARGVDYRLCPTGGGGKIKDMLRVGDLATPEGRGAYAANRENVFKPQAILDEKDSPLTGFTAANALGPAGRGTCHQGHCMIVDNQRVMRAQIPGTNVMEHMTDQMIHAELTF